MPKPLRISVLGTSGSGKTTLAKELAGKYGLHHIELDVLYWQPNWAGTPMDEFAEKVRHEIDAHDQWVICGNYNVIKNITLPQANVIIWLKLPLYRVFWRGLKRSLKRSFGKDKEIFNGCYESPRKTFFSKDSILLWILHTHTHRVKAFTQLLTPEHFPNADIYITDDFDVENIPLR
jgi:adenylate kinase family enzyme